MQSQVEQDIQKFFSFFCPITYDVMKDPVVASDKITYERAAITQWMTRLEEQGQEVVSPITKKPLKKKLIPNIEMKKALVEIAALHHVPGRDVTLREAVIAMNEDIVPEITGLTRALSSDEFEALDALMHLDLMAQLKLQAPQVVVLGTENHGKSTLLERLIGFPIFPRGKEYTICTRCPTRVKLRRQVGTNISRVFVRNRATQEIVEGTLEHVALGRMCQAVQMLMDDMHQSDPTRLIFDDREVVIEIHVPYCPNIDILDLPGLVAVPKAVADVSYALSKSIVVAESAHSIFMLVVDSRTHPVASLATRLVQECRAEGVEAKTIGVFTKMDTAFVADEYDSRLTKYLRYSNPDSYGYVALPKGWLGCASIPNRLAQPMEALLLAERKERDLLRTEFTKLYQQDKVGMGAIRRCVQHEFEQFICNDWVHRIDKHLKEVFLTLSDKNANLGMPIAPCSAYTPYLANLRAQIPGVFPDFNTSMLEVVATAHEFNAILTDRVKAVCTSADWMGFGTSPMWESVRAGKAAMAELTPRWQQPIGFDKAVEEAAAAKHAVTKALRQQTQDLKALTAGLSAKFLDALLSKENRPAKNVFRAAFSFLRTAFGLEDMPEVCKLERFPHILQAFRTYIDEQIAASAAKFVALSKGYIESLPDVVNIAYRPDGVRVVATVTWRDDVHAHFDRLVTLYLRETLTNLPALVQGFVVPVAALQQEDCAVERGELLKQMSDIATALSALKRLIDRVNTDNGVYDPVMKV